MVAFMRFVMFNDCANVKLRFEVAAVVDPFAATGLLHGMRPVAITSEVAISSPSEKVSSMPFIRCRLLILRSWRVAGSVAPAGPLHGGAWGRVDGCRRRDASAVRARTLSLIDARGRLSAATPGDTRSASRRSSSRIAKQRARDLAALVDYQPQPNSCACRCPRSIRAGLPAEATPYVEAGRGRDRRARSAARRSRRSGATTTTSTSCATPRASSRFTSPARRRRSRPATACRVRGVKLDNAIVLAAGVDHATGADHRPAACRARSARRRRSRSSSISAMRPTQPFTVAYAQNVMLEHDQQLRLRGLVPADHAHRRRRRLVHDLGDERRVQLFNIATQARQAAAAAGFALAQLFPIRLRRSRPTPAGGGAWARWAAAPSHAWVHARYGFSLTVVGHEMGHNLGLYHSHSLDCGDAAVAGSRLCRVRVRRRLRHHGRRPTRLRALQRLPEGAPRLAQRRRVAAAHDRRGDSGALQLHDRAHRGRAATRRRGRSRFRARPRAAPAANGSTSSRGRRRASTRSCVQQSQRPDRRDRPQGDRRQRGQQLPARHDAGDGLVDRCRAGRRTDVHRSLDRHRHHAAVGGRLVEHGRRHLSACRVRAHRADGDADAERHGVTPTAGASATYSVAVNEQRQLRLRRIDLRPERARAVGLGCDIGTHRIHRAGELPGRECDGRDRQRQAPRRSTPSPVSAANFGRRPRPVGSRRHDRHRACPPPLLGRSRSARPPTRPPTRSPPTGIGQCRHHDEGAERRDGASVARR